MSHKCDGRIIVVCFFFSSSANRLFVVNAVGAVFNIVRSVSEAGWLFGWCFSTGLVSQM